MCVGGGGVGVGVCGIEVTDGANLSLSPGCTFLLGEIRQVLVSIGKMKIILKDKPSEKCLAENLAQNGLSENANCLSL